MPACFLELFDFSGLVLWQDIAENPVNAHLLGNGLGCQLIVTRQHDGFNPHLMEEGNGLTAGLLNGICHRNQTQKLLFLTDIHRGFPLGSQSLSFLLKIPDFNTLLGHPLAIS